MNFSSSHFEQDFFPEKSDILLSSELETNRSFQDIAALFANNSGTVFLVSGSSADCARYNILGVNPWLSLDRKSVV